jgi:hypothetical protein
MADPVLFALGVLVTAVVAIAVWNVGQMDVDGEPRPASSPGDPSRDSAA